MATDDVSLITANILKVCKNGCTKEKIIEQTHLSHDQLRRITAEIVDKGFLRYIDQQIYITTDKDTYFLIITRAISKNKTNLR
jgi:predicted transcriptional regulator